MRPNDFGFEEFHQFDKQIPETIQNPDKSYQHEEDDRELRTYVRTYSKTGQTYHHVIVGVVVPDEQTKTEVYVPIIFFVTRDDEVVKCFSVGEVMSRPTLN